MNAIVVSFGALVCALGLLGLLRPAALLRGVEHAWRHPIGPHFAFAWRATLGVALLAGAESLRFPRALAALGVFSLAAAFGVVALGRARMLDLAAWWRARPSRDVRAAALLACGFGALLVWSALPA
jgi:hypothetical protein